MPRYYLNLGSNLGDKRMNLSRAIAKIENRFGYFELSKSFSSRPWGFDSKNSFLNIGMMIESDIEPAEMIIELKNIEKSISSASHRDAEGNYADRVIDIDIMAADDLIIDTEMLKLPHPHLPERKFFIVPFMELNPGWIHPATGESLMDMYRKLPE